MPPYKYVVLSLAFTFIERTQIKSTSRLALGLDPLKIEALELSQ
jgi:hypothetical protein